MLRRSPASRRRARYASPAAARPKFPQTATVFGSPEGRARGLQDHGQAEGASREGVRPRSRGSSSRRAIESAASTCPAGSERSTESASPAARKRCPRSVPLISSITSSGKCERFATVSFLTLPPSR